MKLVVCSMADLSGEAQRHRPAGVVSLLAPDQVAPEISGDPARLMLRRHDIDTPRAGLVAPDGTMIARLLTFTASLGPGATVLIHCWMGISRSPAAAFVVACAHQPRVSEAAIAADLRQRAPTATPNPAIVRLADAHLGRRGRMVSAIAQIGRGSEAASGPPFMLELSSLEC